MPKPHYQTRNVLCAILAPTDRAKCKALGLPENWRGTIARIRSGEAVSLDKENVVRLRLGLPVLSSPLIPTPPCPIHGVVHDAGPCSEDKPVAAVVVLAPGETVRRPAKAKRRPPVRRPWMGAELTAAMDAAGMTDEDVRQIVAREVSRRKSGKKVYGGTVITEELRQHFHAANATRALHGEDDSPEYARLADDAARLLEALIMARLSEVQHGALG